MQPTFFRTCGTTHHGACFAVSRFARRVPFSENVHTRTIVLKTNTESAVTVHNDCPAAARRGHSTSSAACTPSVLRRAPAWAKAPNTKAQIAATRGALRTPMLSVVFEARRVDVSQRVESGKLGVAHESLKTEMVLRAAADRTHEGREDGRG